MGKTLTIFIPDHFPKGRKALEIERIRFMVNINFPQFSSTEVVVVQPYNHYGQVDLPYVRVDYSGWARFLDWGYLGNKINRLWVKSVPLKLRLALMNLSLKIHRRNVFNATDLLSSEKHRVAAFVACIAGAYLPNMISDGLKNGWTEAR